MTEYLALPADAFPRGVYLMRVVGDSMTGDGIREGNLLVVDPGQQARDGDIADIRVIWRDESTGKRMSGRIVKRLRDGGTVFESSNPKYPDMTLKPGEIAVVMRRALAALAVSSEGIMTVTPFTGGGPYQLALGPAASPAVPSGRDPQACLPDRMRNGDHRG